MFIKASICLFILLDMIQSINYESGAISLSAGSYRIKSGTIWFTKSYIVHQFEIKDLFVEEIKYNLKYFHQSEFNLILFANFIQLFYVSHTKIPSIAVFPAAYSQLYDIAAQIEYTFSVSGTTTAKFDYRLETLWNGISWILFYWRATDDSKIEVIDSFNTNMTFSDGSKTFTFTHLNPLALYGFVVPINFCQSGDIQQNYFEKQLQHNYIFQVDIISITSTDVIVQVTKNTTNFLSLGFQVILGTEPSFIQEAPQTRYGMARTIPSSIYTNIQLSYYIIKIKQKHQQIRNQDMIFLQSLRHQTIPIKILERVQIYHIQ